MPRAWLLLSLVALLAGCGPKIKTAGGKLPTDVPRSIVSLSPSTTEILALDGNSGQLVGRTSACNHPAYVIQSLPVYGGVKPDYEKLASAKPELVVFDGSLYSEADKTKLKELGLKLFEFHAGTVDEFEAQLRELGDKVDAPMYMSQYIDRINNARGEAKTAAPSTPPRVAAFTGTLAAGTKGFVGSVIKACGGEPVGPDADRFAEFNPEMLVQANPDVILLAVDISQHAAFKDKTKQAEVAQAAVDKFVADPRYKALNACKNKRVYPLDSDVLLRQGVRVDKLIGALGSIIQSVGN